MSDSQKQETIADIIAEKRKRIEEIRCNLSAVPIRREEQLAEIECIEVEVSRLEAAWKREKAEIEADALNVGAVVATTEKSSAVGNASAMREALELAIEVGDWCCANTDDPLECREYSCVYQVEPHGEPGVDCPWKKIRAALSAPPRNCDIHTDFNDAIKTLANKRNWHDGKWDSERYCILASWLLATTDERKGESDGSK